MTQPETPAANPVLKTTCDPGQQATVAENPGYREVHLSLQPLENESATDFIGRLAWSLDELGARVVRQEVFGDLALRDELLQQLSRQVGRIAWPVTWTEGAGCRGHRLAGMHLTAISGIEPEIVEYRGRIVGTFFQEGANRHCYLGGLVSERSSGSRPDQAAGTFELIEAVLEQVGMSLSHLVRTWFFLDGILAWYDDFNRVRTDFFQSRRIFGGLVPASTGVGARNPHGAAVQAAARALHSRDDSWSAREVRSPLQCSACDYGSSFSRAVELITPALRQLMVSGTASIAPGGASVCSGDLRGQIDLTMKVVQAILATRQMSFADASRVTAYFKSTREMELFDHWRSALGLQEWPVVYAQADICRDELRFEIEMDLLAAIQPPS